eukprot:1139977-Pelagomonas_calceolata.AAC.1
MNRAHDMRSAGTRRDQKASKEQSVAYDDRAHDMRSAGTTATGCDASLIRSKARSILRGKVQQGLWFITSREEHSKLRPALPAARVGRQGQARSTQQCPEGNAWNSGLPRVCCSYNLK